jgi:hypothetical protein
MLEKITGGDQRGFTFVLELLLRMRQFAVFLLFSALIIRIIGCYVMNDYQRY